MGVDHDEYKKLLETAKRMAAEGVKVRESVITDELYDLILFLTHSFVRPIDTELYGLKHQNVKIVDEPKCKRRLLPIGCPPSSVTAEERVSF